MCLAPLILIGYLFTLHPNYAHKTELNGMIVDVQTCERGIGLHARATESGMYGFGLHYGVNWTSGPWSLTVQPRAGLSYVDHPIRELPLRKQFELGAQMLFGYNRARLAIDYWHLSNAGLKHPNIGIDTIAIMGGWAF